VAKGGRRTLKKKESQLKISFVILNRWMWFFHKKLGY
jgi:hypothetical protein